MATRLPALDDGVRERLTRRFGPQVGGWFDELPGLLRGLATSWGIELGAPIPRGSVSVVVRCRLPDGRRGVLKVSPDRDRIAREAAALALWTTPHTPRVLASDERLGALLIEAIEPGTSLVDAPAYPSLDSVAELLASLHASGADRSSYPPVAQRVAYLFDSSARLYEAYPELAERVPQELYERGRALALMLAAESPPPVLLHGDLTPGNVLDGGERGLVAIDPAPCVGDPAFDAVDLVFWRADDVQTIETRSRELAAATGADPGRLLAWCRAFAAMTALELASSPARRASGSTPRSPSQVGDGSAPRRRRSQAATSL